MNQTEKSRLKRQLEQQADRLISESDEEKLAFDIINTCRALLVTANKILPASAEDTMTKRIYSSYTGIAALVKTFYQDHGHSDVDEENASDPLPELISSWERLEEERKKKETEIAEWKSKIASKQRENSERTAELHQARIEYEECVKIHKEVQAEYKEKQRRRDDLQAELTDWENRTKHFESDIQQLAEQVKYSRLEFAELQASFPEYERMQKAMEEEGFVDIASLTEKVSQMNQQGEDLRDRYEKLLDNVVADVDTLLADIDRRRKSG